MQGASKKRLDMPSSGPKHTLHLPYARPQPTFYQAMLGLPHTNPQPAFYPAYTCTSHQPFTYLGMVSAISGTKGPGTVPLCMRAQKIRMDVGWHLIPSWHSDSTLWTDSLGQAHNGPPVRPSILYPKGPFKGSPVLYRKLPSVP